MVGVYCYNMHEKHSLRTIFFKNTRKTDGDPFEQKTNFTEHTGDVTKGFSQLLYSLPTTTDDGPTLYYCTELERFIEIDIPKRPDVTEEQLRIIETYMGDVIADILNNPAPPETE